MNVRRKTAALFVAVFILSVAPAAALGQSSRHPALIFTGIANPDSLDNYPMGYRAVIFVFDRRAWRFIYLPEQDENAGWVYAGRVRAGPRSGRSRSLAAATSGRIWRSPTARTTVAPGDIFIHYRKSRGSPLSTLSTWHATAEAL